MAEAGENAATFKPASSPLQSENIEGWGATRLCRFNDGTELTERIVGYVDGESMNVAFVEFMPLKAANVHFRVRAVGAAQTEVTIHMEYTMKYGPLGALISAAVLKPTMRKVFARMLVGLETHVNTGALIGADDALPAAA